MRPPGTVAEHRERLVLGQHEGQVSEGSSWIYCPQSWSRPFSLSEFPTPLASTCALSARGARQVAWASANPTTDKVTRHPTPPRCINTLERRPFQRSLGLRDNLDEGCLAVLNNLYGDGIRWHDVACSHRKPVVCASGPRLPVPHPPHQQH